MTVFSKTSPSSVSGIPRRQPIVASFRRIAANGNADNTIRILKKIRCGHEDVKRHAHMSLHTFAPLFFFLCDRILSFVAWWDACTLRRDSLSHIRANNWTRRHFFVHRLCHQRRLWGSSLSVLGTRTQRVKGEYFNCLHWPEPIAVRSFHTCRAMSQLKKNSHYNILFIFLDGYKIRKQVTLAFCQRH